MLNIDGKRAWGPWELCQALGPSCTVATNCKGTQAFSCPVVLSFLVKIGFSSICQQENSSLAGTLRRIKGWNRVPTSGSEQQTWGLGWDRLNVVAILCYLSPGMWASLRGPTESLDQHYAVRVPPHDVQGQVSRSHAAPALVSWLLSPSPSLPSKKAGSPGITMLAQLCTGAPGVRLSPACLPCWPRPPNYEWSCLGPSSPAHSPSKWHWP